MRFCDIYNNSVTDDAFNLAQVKYCPNENYDFSLRSMKTKILTTGIQMVFRGLKFESDKGIGEKDSFGLGSK